MRRDLDVILVFKKEPEDRWMFAADRNFWENLSEDPFTHDYFIKNMPVIKIHVMKLHTHKARHSSKIVSIGYWADHLEPVYADHFLKTP